MQTITLNIGGMTCGGCVNSVTRVLTALMGVSSANVDLASGTAQVVFDDTQIHVAALIDAVEDAGFDATWV